MEYKLKGIAWLKYCFQISNFRLNINWSPPIMPGGPISYYHLEITELNEKEGVNFET